MIMISIFFLLNILPNVLFSITNVALSTGCSKQFIEIIFGYPAILILPAFTYFSIGPKNILCCKGSNYTNLNPRLAFSKRLTLINMALTFIQYTITPIITDLLLGGGCNASLYFGVLCSGVFILSMLFTIIFLVLDMQCCCSRCQMCSCCWGCCSPNCCGISKDFISTRIDQDSLEIIELP